MSAPAVWPTEPPVHWVPYLQRPGQEVDRPPQSGTTVKNGWLCCAIYLYGVYRGNCHFAIYPSQIEDYLRNIYVRLPRSFSDLKCVQFAFNMK
jgi:hypothetical protein